MNDHDQAPENPFDGQEFKCSCCDYEATFVKLDENHDGEWV